MFYHPETQRKIPEGIAFEINDMQYPQNWLNLTTLQDKNEHAIYEILVQNVPTHDPKLQRAVEGPIVLLDGQYVQTWSIIDIPSEEVQRNLDQATKDFQTMVLSRVQRRLDDFAQTRNYDSILSASTYATSAIPKFAAEGQYAVNARDTTWATLYTLLAEVQAGTRAMPSTYEEIEVLLPTLTWPA